MMSRTKDSHELDAAVDSGQYLEDMNQDEAKNHKTLL